MYIYYKEQQKNPRQQSNEIIPDYLLELYKSETYKLIVDLRAGRTRTVALIAHNGKYVSAVNGGGDILIANKDQIGNFEVFTLIPIGIQAERIVIRTSRGYYFSAPSGGGGSLNARKTSIGPEESFNIVPLYPESNIAIRTQKDYYIVAEEPSGLLRANRLAIGLWETFTIVPLDLEQRKFLY